MKLAPNFSDSEFFTKETYDKLVKAGHIPGWHIDFQLCRRLQIIRDYFQKPVKITRGFATVEENKADGGKEFSMHLRGNAVDFYIDGVTSQQIFDMIKGKWNTGAVGMINDRAVHLDSRNSESLVIIKY